MIGSRIKEIREKTGLTQTELAKKLGLTRSGVNAWEMGVSIPSAQYLIGLANLFKVSIDYLLGLDQKETIDVSSLTSDDKAIIYSLMDYFNQRKHTICISEEDFLPILEEYELLEKNGVKVPAYIRKILDNYHSDFL